MNYLKVYCNLIRKAEKRGYTKKKAKDQGLYVEGHHTFPVSIYGKNKRIVYLTAREHYIAHALLEKICIRRYGLYHWKSQKMNFAHNSMKCKKKYFNSLLYERSKIRKSEIIRKNKTFSGKNNSMYGKKHSLQTIQKISASRQKIDKETRVNISSNAGKKAYEKKVGIFSLSKEQLQECGKLGAKKCEELGLGIFGLNQEQRRKNSKKSGKISSSQRWMCLVTGHICNAGPLTCYQKARGIDTSQRVRVK